MDTSVDVAGRQTLPVIAFDGRSDEVLAGQLDQAFSDIGFCYFSDIGVDPAVVEVATRPRFFVTAARADRMVMGSNFTTLPMRPRTSALPDRFTAALSARNSRSNLPRSASCAVSTISAKLVPDCMWA